MRLTINTQSELAGDVFATLASLQKREHIVVNTSGTTGIPKSIAIDPTKLVDKYTPISKMDDERWVLLYHPSRYAGISVIAHVMRREADLIVPNSLSYIDILNTLSSTWITHVSLTPSLFLNILMSIKNYDIGGFVGEDYEVITFGGEYTSQRVLDIAKEHFPNTMINHVYASTEFGDICAVSDGFEGIPERKFNKDRFSWDDKELLIDGKHTGDLFELRDERYYFLGRVDEIINVGGVKVSPFVVEDTAMRNGADTARAYGIKSPLLGSIVGLEYVSKDISPKEMQKRLACTLTKYELPMKISCVEEIELTAAYKRRRSLV